MYACSFRALSSGFVKLKRLISGSHDETISREYFGNSFDVYASFEIAADYKVTVSFRPLCLVYGLWGFHSLGDKGDKARHIQFFRRIGVSRHGGSTTLGSIGRANNWWIGDFRESVSRVVFAIVSLENISIKSDICWSIGGPGRT